MEVDWDKVMCAQSVTADLDWIKKIEFKLQSFGILLENEMKNEDENFKQTCHM